MYDIQSGRSVDPEPQNWAKPYNERVRCNRFASQYWDHRLCELLTEGEFNPDKTYENLAMKGDVRAEHAIKFIKLNTC